LLRRILILFFLLFIYSWRSPEALALVPIESLLLGNFSENYSENENDPLNYVFSRDRFQSTNASYKYELAMYRGFYEEGKNLNNFCKENRNIHYRSEWERAQVKRALFSEIQYIGLDIATRALPQYAKALEFTKEEYNNLVGGLVGNFCSANLSVISKKELLNNLLIKFDKENNFKLPDVSGNPFFPDNLETYISKKTAIEQEFKYTVKLFQSICSWNGDPYNPGLMLPIIKNPAIISFFFRQMDNQIIDWKAQGNLLYLKNDKNTIQVWCENLICRKTSNENFYRKVYYSVGGTNLIDDLKRLYCMDLEPLKNSSTDSDERLLQIMKSRSSDEENFINSQFIALLTGVPDFLLGLEKFTLSEDLFRSGIDYTWSKWARGQVDLLNRELFFEEPLTLELISRNLYFNAFKSEIKIALDVNLGEFDRINQRNGKIRVSFNILVQRSFIHYYREATKNLDPRNTLEKEHLLKRFKLQLSKDLTIAREKFIIPPWKGDLEALIATELTEQLLLISDSNFKMPNSGVEPINVELNYGLFALKYINQQNIIQNARKKNSTSLNKMEQISK
jgi:hypothetical protein